MRGTNQVLFPFEQKLPCQACSQKHGVRDRGEEFARRDTLLAWCRSFWCHMLETGRCFMMRDLHLLQFMQAKLNGLNTMGVR